MESKRKKGQATENLCANKVFLTKIPSCISNRELKQLLQQFGKVVNVHIPRDCRTNSKRSYGFVTFDTSEAAEKAHKRKIIIARGYRIIVNRAREKHLKSLANGTFLETLMEVDSVSGCEGDVNLISLDDTDSECKISMLNNDCLQHILSFLSKRELIKVERVCKWWQSVSRDCWHMKNEIAIADFLKYPRPSYSPTDKNIESLFRRCGRYVKHLEFNPFLGAFLYSTKAMAMIARLCPVLEYLEVSCIPLEITGLKPRVYSLKELKIKRCSGTDEDFNRLFIKYPNVKSLSIADTMCFHGESMRSLNKTQLEKLTLSHCHNVNIAALVANLKCMVNLKCLEVTVMNEFRMVCIDFVKIIEVLPQLEKLSFPSCSFYRNNIPIPIGRLNKLVSLDFHGCIFVDDVVVKEIAENCKNLEVLDISDCGAGTTDNICITDAGIRSLIKLPHLKDLSINYLWLVTDDALLSLALAGRLRSLEIRGNLKVTDVGCSKIVSLCENLENFDVSGCPHVTNSTVESALASAIARTNDKILTFTVGATSVVDLEKWKECTLLNVSFKNNCVKRAPFYNYNIWGINLGGYYDDDEEDEDDWFDSDIEISDDDDDDDLLGIWGDSVDYNSDNDDFDVRFLAA